MEIKGGDSLNNLEIAKCVHEYVNNYLTEEPKEKRNIELQKFVWSLGDGTRKTGPEVLEIYYEAKSKNEI